MSIFSIVRSPTHNRLVDLIPILYGAAGLRVRESVPCAPAGSRTILRSGGAVLLSNRKPLSKSGRAEPGCELFARSECYKLGHNIAFVRATAWDRDQNDPFAGCLGTFMIGANSGGSPFGGLKDTAGAKS